MKNFKSILIVIMFLLGSSSFLQAQDPTPDSWVDSSTGHIYGPAGKSVLLNGTIRTAHLKSYNWMNGSNAIIVGGSTNRDMWMNFRTGGSSPAGKAGSIYSYFSSSHFFLNNHGGNLDVSFSSEVSDKPNINNATRYFRFTKTGSFVVYNSGNSTGQVSIGAPTANPGIVLRSNAPYGYRSDIRRTTEGLAFAVKNSTSIPPVRMMISNAGKVSIGSVDTTPDDYKLFVEKGILAEKVKVAVKTSSDWADDAFGNKPSLEDVEQFIEKNSHLPEVPSADEVVKNGIDLAQMDATLLRQIEWLWEHMIEQEKEIKALKKQLEKKN